MMRQRRMEMNSAKAVHAESVTITISLINCPGINTSTQQSISWNFSASGSGL